ncbi:hypothetical protein B0J11DRAFT_273462 [Dendryphion nanum]|uniref:Uncharacterized protein n=1 Tax=Dendryphion nanum TaxID=256645 RepID=A0A9P9IN11_9PLEO|nr:hypothetical protein B0J11DRAFT_273462 [Dendryphion nanum]
MDPVLCAERPAERMMGAGENLEGCRISGCKSGAKQWKRGERVAQRIVLSNPLPVLDPMECRQCSEASGALPFSVNSGGRHTSPPCPATVNVTWGFLFFPMDRLSSYGTIPIPIEPIPYSLFPFPLFTSHHSSPGCHATRPQFYRQSNQYSLILEPRRFPVLRLKTGGRLCWLLLTRLQREKCPSGKTTPMTIMRILSMLAAVYASQRRPQTVLLWYNEKQGKRKKRPHQRPMAPPPSSFFLLLQNLPRPHFRSNKTPPRTHASCTFD